MFSVITAVIHSIIHKVFIQQLWMLHKVRYNC